MSEQTKLPAHVPAPVPRASDSSKVTLPSLSALTDGLSLPPLSAHHRDHSTPSDHSGESGYRHCTPVALPSLASLTGMYPLPGPGSWLPSSSKNHGVPQSGFYNTATVYGGSPSPQPESVAPGAPLAPTVPVAPSVPLAPASPLTVDQNTHHDHSQEDTQPALKRMKTAEGGSPPLRRPFGAPKTSRFHRVSEWSSGSAPRSGSAFTHHYNPFIYTQNRGKTAHQPEQVPSKTANNSSMNRSLLVDEIPVVHPTEDEFKDPAAYLESLAELGQQYGAVKIVPPSSFASQQAPGNLEQLWFRTRRQRWNSHTNELNARYWFYRRLAETSGAAMTKLPCIDKRSIDLYRLQKSVLLRGGYERCCSEKMWAQVGRELGFYGKITSSLSSSIKSAYQRYVLPLDLQQQGELPLRVERQIGEPDDLPRIVGSSTEFSRKRQWLVDAGFDACFDQLTTQRRGITVNDDQTLPTYDFYDWHRGRGEVDDCSPFETRVSSLYNIKQLRCKSQVLRQQVLKWLNLDETAQNNFQTLEEKFWELFKDPDMNMETEIALNASTKIHESGFECRAGVSVHPWNLHFLPVVKRSLLKFVGEDADSLLRPSVTVGMFFSAQSWNMEDHFLLNADYLHLGERKMWYFIAPEHQEQYEKLLREQFIGRKEAQDSKLGDYLDKFHNLVANSDIFSVTLENRVLGDPQAARNAPKDEKFCEFASVGKPLQYNEELFIPPQVLAQHGIKVHGTLQAPGELVVKFPRCYSANICLGTTVNESVRLATKCWLPHAGAAALWLAEQQLLPRFSTFRLLASIATGCECRDVLRELDPVLEQRIGEELELRDAARKKTTIKETNGSGENARFAADSDLTETYPTCVVLTDRNDAMKTFTLSLRSFVRDYDATRHDFKVEMVTYLSDEALRGLHRTVKAKLLTGQEWLDKYQELISGYDKPPMKLVRPLLVEGESIFQRERSEIESHEMRPLAYYENLKANYKLTEEWAGRTAKFLQFKATARMRHRKSVETESRENWNDARELDLLLKEIPHLPLSTPEMDQLIEFASEVVRFNGLVVSLLQSASATGDDKELENLHILGQSFGVKLDSFLLLDRIVKRREWLKTVAEIDYFATTTGRIKELIDEGQRVGSSADAGQLKSLREVYNRAISANNELRFYVRSVPILAERVQLLFESYEELPLEVDLRAEVIEMLHEHSQISAQIESVVSIVEERRVELTKGDGDLILHSIETDLSFCKSSSGVTVAHASELVQKAAKFSSLDARRQLLQMYLDRVESWFSHLHTCFSGLPQGKKLKPFLESCRKNNEEVLAETKQSSNYCVCRQSHENGYMIECECCEQWFHFSCLGLDEKNEADSNINGFLCPTCDVGLVFKSTQFHRERMSKKPEFGDVLEFLRWSDNHLWILPVEFRVLLEIAKACCLFERGVEGELREGGGGLVESAESVRFLLRKMDGCWVEFGGLREHLMNESRAKRAMSESSGEKVEELSGEKVEEPSGETMTKEATGEQVNEEASEPVKESNDEQVKEANDQTVKEPSREQMIEESNDEKIKHEEPTLNGSG